MGKHEAGSGHQAGNEQRPASWYSLGRLARAALNDTPAPPVTKHDGTQTRR